MATGRRFWAAVVGAPRRALQADIRALVGGGADGEAPVVRAVYDEALAVARHLVGFGSERERDAACARVGRLRTLGSLAVTCRPVTEDDAREQLAAARAAFPNKAKEFGGKAGEGLVLLTGVSQDATVADLEHFFAGFATPPRPFAVFQVAAPQGRQQAGGRNVSGREREQRAALVRLSSESEAFRALREKHREILCAAPVSVSLLE